jgi:hypothetical protein
MKKCDQFRAGDLVIKAYASKKTETQARLGCGKANRIMRAWWRGPDAGGNHPDGFPEWRCNSGSGGGSCTHGDKVAGYQNRVR